MNILHPKLSRRTYGLIAVITAAVLLFVPPLVSIIWITVSPQGRLLRGGEGERWTVRTKHRTYTGTLREARLEINDVVGFVGLRAIMDDVVWDGMVQAELSDVDGASVFLSAWNLNDATLIRTANDSGESP